MSLKDTAFTDTGDTGIAQPLPMQGQTTGHARFSRIQRRNWRNRRKARGPRPDQRGTM